MKPLLSDSECPLSAHSRRQGIIWELMLKLYGCYAPIIQIQIKY